MEKKKLNPTLVMLIALALGLVTGLVLGEKAAVLQSIGDIFIKLIKMVVIPIVMCSIITATTNIGDMKKLGRVGSKTLILYILTTAMAAVLGIILATATHLGEGVVLEAAADEVVTEGISIGEVFANIVPSNIFSAMANFETLPCIVFSLLFGISLLMLGERSRPVVEVLEICNEALQKLVGIVMKVAPIGIFCLIASGIGQYGAEVFAALGQYLILAYIVVALLFVVYLLLIKFFSDVPVKKFLSGGVKIAMTAFTTRSSAATLPVNIDTTVNEFGVPEDIARFTLPIGCTINMNGAATGFAMKAVLAGFIFGHPLTLPQLISTVVICTISGIGMPGIPNAALVFNVLLFSTLGFPNGALIGMLASVESLEDMIQTAGNVLGDSACAVLVAASEKKREAK